MEYTWRCPKCFRYLSQIITTSKQDNITQRTVCPRCKSENKITLNCETVIISCGFSRKYASNLVKMPIIEAPDTNIQPVDNLLKIKKEVFSFTKIVVVNDKKDSN